MKTLGKLLVAMGIVVLGVTGGMFGALEPGDYGNMGIDRSFMLVPVSLAGGLIFAGVLILGRSYAWFTVGTTFGNLLAVIGLMPIVGMGISRRVLGRQAFERFWVDRRPTMLETLALAGALVFVGYLINRRFQGKDEEEDS